MSFFEFFVFPFRIAEKRESVKLRDRDCTDNNGV